MEGIENSYGRLFLKHQLPKEVNHLAKTLESIVAIKGKVTCQRCHYQITAEARLPSGTYYCRFCLVFTEIKLIYSLLYTSTSFSYSQLSSMEGDINALPRKYFKPISQECSC